MFILITNDDGIHAPGLTALFHELKQRGEVAVVAPESEQSAVGHAISLSHPLRVKEVDLKGGGRGWAVNGTPADCVKIGVAEILPRLPDLVISGINLGPNVGINVLYSGTVSAATEAAILGVKAAAVSLHTYQDADFLEAARVFAGLLPRLQQWPGWGNGICLNVNLPAVPGDKIRGVRVVRQEICPLVERFERRVDPRAQIYYWLAGINDHRPQEFDTDYGSLQAGYITITPIHHDLTHYPSLRALKGLIEI